MAQFFRTGLVKRYDESQLVDGILNASSADPIFGFHLPTLGKEILQVAAKNQGMDVTTFIRRALVQTIESIYTETSFGEE